MDARLYPPVRELALHLYQSLTTHFPSISSADLSPWRLSSGLYIVPDLSRSLIIVSWGIKTKWPEWLKTISRTQWEIFLFFQPFSLLFYPHSYLWTNKYMPDEHLSTHTHTNNYTIYHDDESPLLSSLWTNTASLTTINNKNRQRGVKNLTISDNAHKLHNPLKYHHASLPRNPMNTRWAHTTM